jgi:hypothetical protein
MLAEGCGYPIPIGEELSADVIPHTTPHGSITNEGCGDKILFLRKETVLSLIKATKCLQQVYRADNIRKVFSFFQILNQNRRIHLNDTCEQSNLMS